MSLRVMRRTRGGAFLADKKIVRERTIQYQNFQPGKRESGKQGGEIAEFAVRFIKEGQSIALDSGTTAYELARVIRGRSIP